MNRPFGAFGALLTLLVLAMFAVSSPDRCTTIHPQPAGCAPSAAKLPLRATRAMVCLPAASIERVGGEDECLDAGCYDGSLSDEQLTALLRGGNGRPAPMTSARIQSADNTAVLWKWAPGPEDYRSHYDALYDRLIYGRADDDLPRGRTIAARPIEEPAGLDSDWLITFQSLVAPEKLRSLSQSGPSYRWQGGSPSCLALSSAITFASIGRGAVCASFGSIHPRSILSSFTRWLDQRVDRLAQEWGWSEQKAVVETSLGWDEYAELINRASRADSASALATRASDRRQGVRSSGWLRHSAASSLYQLGLFLQAAGQELDAAAVQ